jgi:hypothetical protein
MAAQVFPSTRAEQSKAKKVLNEIFFYRETGQKVKT